MIQIRTRLGKKGIHGRVPRLKPLQTKKNTKACLTFAKTYLDYPQDFWANILWTDETKVELFGRCVFCYIWHKTSTAIHKKNIIPAVRHGGGSVLICGCFAASGPGRLDNWWNQEFCTLSENPEGECPAVSLWPQAQAHLGYTAGQWSRKHQQVHLWMAQEKQFFLEF